MKTVCAWCGDSGCVDKCHELLWAAMCHSRDAHAELEQAQRMAQEHTLHAHDSEPYAETEITKPLTQ